MLFCPQEKPGIFCVFLKQKKECLMEIEVYDTYARSEEGLKIHFDVMLPSEAMKRLHRTRPCSLLRKFLKPPTPSNSKAVGFVTLKPQSRRSERGRSRKAIVLFRSKTVRIPRIDFPQHSSADQKMERKPLKREKPDFYS